MLETLAIERVGDGVQICALTGFSDRDGVWFESYCVHCDFAPLLDSAEEAVSVLREHLLTPEHAAAVERGRAQRASHEEEMARLRGEAPWPSPSAG